MGSWVRFWPLGLGGLVFAGAAAILLVVGPPAPPLHVYGAVPAFRLVNEQGVAFGSQELAGKVWVANFIFTRCPTICPAFSQKMAQIQDHMTREDVPARLISFSVDPSFDTPAVLKEYAGRYGADPARWTFLTGSLDVIKGTVVEGLKVAMDDTQQGKPEGILHGSHFVVVDGLGQIRGYFDSKDPGVVVDVVEAAERLAGGGG